MLPVITLICCSSAFIACELGSEYDAIDNWASPRLARYEPEPPRTDIYRHFPLGYQDPPKDTMQELEELANDPPCDRSRQSPNTKR